MNLKPRTAFDLLVPIPNSLNQLIDHKMLKMSSKNCLKKVRHVRKSLLLGSLTPHPGGECFAPFKVDMISVCMRTLVAIPQNDPEHKQVKDGQTKETWGTPSCGWRGGEALSSGANKHLTFAKCNQKSADLSRRALSTPHLILKTPLYLLPGLDVGNVTKRTIKRL